MEKIQEKLLFSAILIEKKNIKEIMPKISKNILSKDKIPSIIHLDRSYEVFTINIYDIKTNNKIKFDNEFNSKHVAILVDKPLDQFQTINLELILNANFYSHTELIFKLTDGNIQFSAYEIIGDIIHLNLNEEQQKYKKIIGDVIFFKTGKTVINKTGKIEESFRYYHSEVLAGPNVLKTVHKENGVKFFLDLEKVYWCSRLQTERIRIIQMIKKGETVCDPFCGAGPHVLPAIKKGAKALCNDLNPSAIECLKKSLEINKLKCDLVENTDAKTFLEKISNEKVDHFIFNLPEYSLDYIKFTENFKDKFYIHVFFFNRNEQNCKKMIELRTGYKVKDDWLREVRKVSPAKSVYKLEVKSDEFFDFQDKSNNKY